MFKVKWSKLVPTNHQSIRIRERKSGSLNPKEFAEVLNIRWCLMSLIIKAQNDWRDVGRSLSCNASQLRPFLVPTFAAFSPNLCYFYSRISLLRLNSMNELCASACRHAKFHSNQATTTELQPHVGFQNGGQLSRVTIFQGGRTFNFRTDFCIGLTMIMHCTVICGC